MTRRNSAGRRLAQAFIAVAAVAAFAAPGASALPLNIYGASTFDTDAQGWTASGASCTALGLPALCASSAGHTAGAGHPAGALDYAGSVALVGNFAGSVTMTSPAIPTPASPAPIRAAIGLEGKQVGQGGATLPGGTVTIKLLDQTTPGEKLVGAPIPIAPLPDFIPGIIEIPLSDITPGHTYKIQIKVDQTFTGLLGSNAHTYLDNIALLTADPPAATPPGGGGTTGGDPRKGISIAPPKTNAQMASLLASTNVNAETGASKLFGTSISPTQCTIIGTQGNDTIKGTAGNDVICGFTGNDRIDGGGGNDIIDSGDGNDRISGGAGIDGLLGLKGNDILDGGSGNDRLGGGAGTDRIVGGSGNDRIGGGSANDSLKGDSGADLLDAGKGNDKLDGGSGKDLIGGGAGNDSIKSKDKIQDRVDGGSGKDTATIDFKKVKKPKVKPVKKPKPVKLDIVLRVEKIK